MSLRIALSTVEDRAALRALASTVRLDLIDALQALGQASVPELAEQLGRPADALYYHLRALSRAGLVKKVGERRRDRIVEAVYSARDPSKRLALSHRSREKGARDALSRIVHAMLLSARREYRDASADPNYAVDGPYREIWPGRAMGWLSRQRLGRVNALLTELTQLMSTQRSSPAEKLYALQFVLTPAVPHKPAPNSGGGRPQKIGRKHKAST